MGKKKYIVTSLTPEQYKKFFGNNPNVEPSEEIKRGLLTPEDLSKQIGQQIEQAKAKRDWAALEMLQKQEAQIKEYEIQQKITARIQDLQNKYKNLENLPQNNILVNKLKSNIQKISQNPNDDKAYEDFNKSYDVLVKEAKRIGEGKQKLKDSSIFVSAFTESYFGKTLGEVWKKPSESYLETAGKVLATPLALVTDIAAAVTMGTVSGVGKAIDAGLEFATGEGLESWKKYKKLTEQDQALSKDYIEEQDRLLAKEEAIAKKAYLKEQAILQKTYGSDDSIGSALFMGAGDAGRAYQAIKDKRRDIQLWREGKLDTLGEDFMAGAKSFTQSAPFYSTLMSLGSTLDFASGVDNNHVLERAETMINHFDQTTNIYDGLDNRKMMQGLGHSLGFMADAAIGGQIVEGVGTIAGLGKYVASGSKVATLGKRIVQDGAKTALMDASKATLNNISNTIINGGIKALAKDVAEHSVRRLTQEGVRASFMGSTYQNAKDKMIGDNNSVIIDKLTGDYEILMGSANKLNFVREANNEMEAINNRIKSIMKDPNISTEEKQALVSQLTAEISTKQDMIEQLGDIKEDTSLARALGYSVVENMVENIAERYVGDAGDWAWKGAKGFVGKQIEKRLSANIRKSMSNIAQRTGVAWVSKKANNLAEGAKTFGSRINEVLPVKGVLGALTENAVTRGIGRNRVIHGVPSEMLEEVAVQLAYNPFGNEGEYEQKLAQLKDPQFYTDIFVQTLAMGAMMGTANTLTNPKHTYNMLTDREYEKKYLERLENVKEMQEMLKEISSTGQVKSEHLLKMAGRGIYTKEDWIEQINKAEARGDTAEADILTKRFMRNLMYESVLTGNADQTHYIYRAIKQDKDAGLPISFQRTVDSFWNEEKDILLNSMEKYGNLPNYRDVLETNFNLVDIDIAKKTIEDNQVEHKKAFDEALESLNAKGLFKDFRILDKEEIEELRQNNPLALGRYQSRLNKLFKRLQGTEAGKYLPHLGVLAQLDGLKKKTLETLNNITSEKYQKNLRKNYTAFQIDALNNIDNFNKFKDKLSDAQKEEFDWQLRAKEQELQEDAKRQKINEDYNNNNKKDEDNGETTSTERDYSNFEFTDEENAELDRIFGIDSSNSNPLADLSEEDYARLSFSPVLNGENAEGVHPLVKVLANVYNSAKSRGMTPEHFLGVVHNTLGDGQFIKFRGLFKKFYEDLSGKTLSDQEFLNIIASEIDFIIESRIAAQNAINTSAQANMVAAGIISDIASNNKEKVYNPEKGVIEEVGTELPGSVGLVAEKPDILTVEYEVVNEEVQVPTKEGLITKIKRVIKNKAEKLVDAAKVSNFINPDVTHEGAVFSVRPIREDEFDNHTVTVYRLNEKTGEVKTEYIPFSQWLKENPKVEKGSKEYIEKIPMVVETAEGDYVFNIKETDWYNPTNVQNVPEEELQSYITSHRASNSSDRKQIYEKGSMNLKITRVKPGAVIRTLDGRRIPLSQANPGKKRLVVMKGGVISDANGPITDLNITNNTFFNDGTVLEVREVGKNEYHLFPVSPAESKGGQSTLSDRVFNNIKMALQASIYINAKKKLDRLEKDEANLDEKGKKELSNTRQVVALLEKKGMSLDKANRIVDTINEGLDYGNIVNDIGSYISKFVRVSNSTKELEAGSTVPVGTPVINWFGGGNQTLNITIKEDNAGTDTFENKEGETTTRVKTTGTSLDPNVQGSLNPTGVNILLSMFEGENPPFKKVMVNTSVELLGKNRPMHEISTDGSVKTLDTTYEDHLYDSYHTNVLTAQIPTKSGEVKTVTTVHPVVNYQLEGNEKKVEKKMIQATSSNVPKPPANPQINEDKTEVVKQENKKEEVLDNNKKEETKKLTTAQEARKLLKELQQSSDSNISELFEDMVIFQYSNLAKSAVLFNEKDLDQIERKDDYVEGLTLHQKQIILDSLYGSIFRRYLQARGNNVEKSVDIKLLNDIINEVINEEILSLRDKEVQRLEYLEINGHTNHPLTESLRNKIQVINNIEKVKDGLVGEGSVLRKKIERQLQTNIENTEELNEVEEISEEGDTENYSKSSQEKDIKTNLSTKIKMFFSDIPRINVTTQGLAKNFFGLNDYYDANEVFNIMMANMDRIPSSWEIFMNTLESKKHGNPIITAIHEKLKNAPEDVQNEVLYKFTHNKLKMLTVKIEGHNARVLSENSNTATFRLVKEWLSNIETMDQPIVSVDDEGLKNYDRDHIKILVDNLNDLLKDINAKYTLALKEDPKISIANFLTPEMFISTLADFGIQIDQATAITILNQEGSRLLSAKSPLKILSNVYSSILKDKDIKYDASNHRKLVSNMYNQLATYQTKVIGSIFSGSFRVNGKNIQEAILPILSKQLVNELKNPNSDYYKRLKNSPYSANSFFLEAITKDAGFREYYDIDFQSIRSLSKDNINNDKTKINEVSDTDKEVATTQLFQHTEKTLTIKAGKNSTIKVRVGRQSNMTISDKANMLLHAMPMLDLVFDTTNKYRSNIVQDENGNLTLSDEVLDFAVEELFMGEFNRIVQALSQDTNINNYDDAARRFSGFPIFNTLTDNEGNNILDVLTTLVEQGEQEGFSMNKAKQDFKEKAKEVLSQFITQESNKKLEQWDKSGMGVEVKKDGKGNEIQVPPAFMDIVYLKSKVVTNENNNDYTTQRKVAALDYTLNYTLGNNYQNKVLNGDLALFAPKIEKVVDKETKNELKKAKNRFERTRIINRFFNNNPQAEKKLATSIGESQLKRMAMMIAPGNILANSYNDKYIQIFVNDVERASANIPFYIKSMYGEVSSEVENLSNQINKAYDRIDELLEKEQNEEVGKEIELLEQTIEKNKEAIEKAYPKVKPFLNITGTDAQEYTTWQEHLDIIFRQGKLSAKKKKVLQSAYEKLSRGEEVNSEELDLIMQPIKPVYAGPTGTADGNSLNEVAGVNRMVYIKSSSFPLLPQLTKNTKLDKVRQTIEEVQKRHGKNVRLSYQSANKVGSVNTKLTMNDIYKGDINELIGTNNEGLVGTSMLEMDRMNFKIQQEVPYKTEKYSQKNSEDYIKMSTQMWKILMSGGINRISEKVFDSTQIDPEIIKDFNKYLEDAGKSILAINEDKINGYQLDELKTFIETTIFNKKLEDFKKRIGLDSIDSSSQEGRDKLIKNIINILKEEIDSRDYSPGLRDSLELVRNEYGDLDFGLPLWLNDNFDKIDNLIQSIVTQNIMKINLPGNSLVSTSSEGFQKVGFDKLDTKTKQGIIWLDPNRTGDLKATRFENGELKESEVLIQPKFKTQFYNKKTKKYETKLIDLQSKNEKGEYIYLNEKDGILSLKEDMIDSSILSNFSFRIPVSSHQSGAIIKVVGFLPQASADMIVLPKEHTTLLGEDYDIDKRYIYKNHYVVDENGKIKRLSNENKDLKIEQEIKFNGKTRERATRDVENSILENSLINIYKSVYSSNNQGVQDKINRILSMEVAENTTKIIKEKLSSTQEEDNDEIFSIYSENYQREQMNSGTSGKIGTAMHSLAVVAQAQYERFGGVEIGEPLTIGRLTSSGRIGETMTIEPAGTEIPNRRTIADVHAENQNSAVDNIKAQIMFWRNENKHTINILIQLTNRGFDQDYLTLPNGEKVLVNVSSLFLAQPILRIYTDIKNKYDGVVNNSYKSPIEVYKEVIETFTESLDTLSDKEKDTLKGNLKQIDSTRDLVEFLDFFLKGSSFEKSLTTEAMYSQLDSKAVSLDTQLSALRQFIVLEEEANKVQKYRKFSNKKDLPKSAMEVLSLQEDFKSIIKDIYKDVVENGVSIDSHPAKTIIKLDKSNPKLQELLSLNSNEVDLYLNTKNIMDFWVPSNTESLSLKNAIQTSMQMSNIVYGGTISMINNAYETYVNTLGIMNRLSEYQKNKIKYELLNEMREYVLSSPNIGLFTGTVAEEKKRLFFEDPTTGHISLAHYMQKLKADPLFNRLFQNVSFLKPFQIDEIDSTGEKPSILKYSPLNRNSASEAEMYEDFLLLLGDNKTQLPDFNGNVMTPQKLAQELAIYAMLAPQEGGTIGFRKYINTQYLKVMGVNYYKNISQDININNFIEEYILQNTNLIKKVDSKSIIFEDKVYYDPNKQVIVDKSENPKSKDSFLLPTGEDANPTHFVTLKDGKEELIYKVDLKNSPKGHLLYTRVEALPKSFGYNSYNVNNEDTFYDVLNREVDKVENLLQEKESTEAEPFIINSLKQRVANLKERGGIVREQVKVEEKKPIQNNLSVKSRLEGKTTKDILKEIKENNPSSSALLDRLIEAAEIEDIEVVYGKLEDLENPAVYIPNKNIIAFNSEADLKNTAENFDRIFIEEVIHAFTVRQLEKYFNGLNTENPSLKEGMEVPQHMKNLLELYKLAKSNIKAGENKLVDYYMKDMKEFIAGVFIDPTLINKLNDIVIEENNEPETLWQKFKKSIASLVMSLSGKKKFSAVVREEVLDFLDHSYKTKLSSRSTMDNNFIGMGKPAKKTPQRKITFNRSMEYTEEQNKNIAEAVELVNTSSPVFEDPQDPTKGFITGSDLHKGLNEANINEENKTKVFLRFLQIMYAEGKFFALNMPNNNRTKIEQDFVNYFEQTVKKKGLVNNIVIVKGVGGKVFISIDKNKGTNNTTQKREFKLKGPLVNSVATEDSLNKDNLINEILDLSLEGNYNVNNLVSLLEKQGLIEKNCD